MECGTGSAQGTNNYSIEFYRLILEDETNQMYEFFVKNMINFYNIVFNCKYGNYSNGYILPVYGKNQMVNCVVPNGNNGFISNQFNTGNIKLKNCYGRITSGYATTDDMWNYQTNYITATPKVNNTTYEITDDESKWKNVGTGTNIDGSQANLGVYGGKYSWDYDIDINF